MLIVLTYSPTHIKREDLESLVMDLEQDGHKVLTITHYKSDEKPIYAVIGGFTGFKEAK